MKSARKTLFYGEDLALLHSEHYADFVGNAAPQVILMLQAAGVKRGVVCDVGCGGGQLAASLLRAGYGVIGIDRSAAMIAIARKRAPGAKFIRSSIVDVTLPECAAAIAVGEVFNYLGSRKTIVRAFRNIFRALQSNGILIFDIKEPPAKKIARTAARLGQDWAVIAEIEEDPARKKLTRRIHSFRKIGRYYRRQVEVHELRIYPAKEIARMLRSVGFHVRTYSGYGKYRMSPDRRVLLARRN